MGRDALDTLMVAVQLIGQETLSSVENAAKPELPGETNGIGRRWQRPCCWIVRSGRKIEISLAQVWQHGQQKPYRYILIHAEGRAAFIGF